MSKLSHRVLDPRYPYLFGRPVKPWQHSPILLKWLDSPIPFLDWIESKKGDHSILGKIHQVADDAITTFLQERAHVTFFNSSQFLMPENENTLYRPPEWVPLFTREMDARSKEKGSDDVEKGDAFQLICEVIEAIKTDPKYSPLKPGARFSVSGFEGIPVRTGPSEEPL